MRRLFNNEIDDFINNKLIISRPKCPIGINGNFKKILKKNPEIIEYLENLYDDCSCIEESLYRFSHNIDDVPKCKICGNPVKFDKNSKFGETCDNKDCIKQNSVNKVAKTKLERYGISTYNNREKMYETKIKNHGDKNYVNPEKMQKTKLERYGTSSYVNPEKMQKTKLERYGTSSYVNPEKAKITSLEKYGVEHPMQYKEIQQKSYQTNLNRHNGKFFTNIEKAKQTKLEKYGSVNNYSQVEKSVYEKYGYKTVFQVPEIAKKIANSKIRKQHEYETKKKRHTFNSSKPELESYELLKEIYQEVVYQYKSDLYPYICDFYIPSEKLYIECNFHWTHGKHPYNEKSIEDQNILNEWKLRNTQFYKNAISTWTIRDVNKRKLAKQNNLNYIEFFNLEELKIWIDAKKSKN